MNAASTHARAAVTAAPASSSARRHRAWVSAPSCAASAAARYPSPACIISIASLAEAGAGAVPTWGHLPKGRAGWGHPGFRGFWGFSFARGPGQGNAGRAHL